MSEKKSFSLKSLFFEEVAVQEEQPKNNTTTPNLQPVNNTVPPQAPIFNPTILNYAPGVIDTKYIKHFEDLLKEANIPGPDYFEFKQAITNMLSMPLDDATKYKLVFATLSTQGLTKEKILESLSSYIKLIQDDKAAFDAELETKKTAEITNRDESINNINSLNESYIKQINELTEKINANSTEINKLNNEKAELNTKLTNSSANYTVSFNSFINDLNADVQKITSFLQ